MPKKKVTINRKAIARNVRISERHKQSKIKVPEENPQEKETNENDNNPKCKLRDVKNNKKKNDKKELSKILFAKVVPEKPKTVVPTKIAVQKKEMATNKTKILFAKVVPEKPKTVVPTKIAVQKKEMATNKTNVPRVENPVDDDKIFIPPQGLPVKKPKKEENAIVPVKMNNLNNPAALKKKEALRFEIPIVQPVNNENTSNMANKIPTPEQPFNGEKVVINYPKIFGRGVDENMAVVPKNRMTRQDFLDSSGTIHFKFALNGKNVTNPINTGPIVYPSDSINKRKKHNDNIQIKMFDASTSTTDLVEIDECVILMEALCQKGKGSATKKNEEIWKNNIFSISEKIIIKFISELSRSVKEASNELNETRDSLKRLIQFQRTNEIQESKINNIKEIKIRREKGSICRIKINDIDSTVNGLTIKERSLTTLEADVRNELNSLIRELPNELKLKLRTAAFSNSNPTTTISDVNSQADFTVNGLTIKEKSLTPLEADVRNELNNIIRQLPNKLKLKLRKAAFSNSNPTTTISDVNSQANTRSSSVEILQNEQQDNVRTITLKSNKERNNKYPFKLTRKQKRNKKKKFGKTKRRSNNALPKTGTNKIKEDFNIANPTNDLPVNLNETYEIFIEDTDDEINETKNDSQTMPNDEIENLEKFLSYPHGILPNTISIRNECNLDILENDDSEEAAKCNLTVNELFFLIRILGNKINSNAEYREMDIKHFMFKNIENGSKDSSALKFVKQYFPFVVDMDEDFLTLVDSKYEEDIDDNKSEENDCEVIDEDTTPAINEVNPEMCERMIEYESIYFATNLLAINQLIPKNPSNEKQYEEYDKKRNELNRKFSDLFNMN